MDNLNDLKKIWLTADTKGLPNSTEMVRIVKKYRNKKLLKTTAIVATAFGLVVMTIFLMFFYKSTMFTTRVGEVCMIISSLILFGTNLNSFNRFYKFNDFDNVDFVKFLEKTRRRQIFYHTKTQVYALAFCSVGLMFYLVEPAYTSVTVAIYLYAFVIVYLAVMWLVVRPRMYKQQSKKMDETIKKFELLTKQMTGPSAEEDL